MPEGGFGLDMAKPPKKPAETDDRQFEKVVQHFLNTPPKPHKPKKNKPKKEGRNK